MSEALAVESLQVVEGGRELLHDVDFLLAGGSVLGILGPSGAGKSTLFRALAGEMAISRGKIRLEGADVTTLPLWMRARCGLGYLPQTPSVLVDLSVADNIRTFECATRRRGESVRDRASTVDLESRLDVRAGDLSGGERRRLELLRVLMGEPRILIVDEPFTGGDPAQIRTIARLLRAHADQGAAVLVADHRVGTALDLCDEAILLVDGRIHVRVPAAEFARHPAVRDRYLERGNP